MSTKYVPNAVPADIAVDANMFMAQWMDVVMQDILPPDIYAHAHTPEGIKKVNAFLKKGGYDIQKSQGGFGKPARVRVLKKGQLFNQFEFHP